MDAAMRDHCAACDARDADSTYVFTSQRAAWLRQHTRPDHLSTRGIMHLWDGLKATSTKDEWALIHGVTFHDLRHDWAHRARTAGWQLEEIAVYAGHQTKDGAPAIATTARYTLPSRQQLRTRLQALSGWAMATKTPRLLRPEQRVLFTRVPDLSVREIARYYTFSPDDLVSIARHRRDANRLGFAVQLALLRFPGRSLTDVSEVPTPILTYIADQVGVTVTAFDQYGLRENTLYEHLEEIRRVRLSHLHRDDIAEVGPDLAAAGAGKRSGYAAD
jgi:hypothetical protein